MILEVDADSDGELSFDEFVRIRALSDQGLNAKLKDAVEQAQLGVLAAGAFRSAMLEQFWKLIFQKGRPLETAFSHWREETEARLAARQVREASTSTSLCISFHFVSRMSHYVPRIAHVSPTRSPHISHVSDAAKMEALHEQGRLEHA